MRRAIPWWRNLLTLGVIGLLLMAGARVVAQTVIFSPATLSFSPAGPYSVPRDAAVGSQVARALAGATATGITCALIETAAVNGTEISAGSGVYQTSVSGIGVSFYIVNGAAQTLITSTGGGYTSGTISAPGNGALPGVQANLIVTGQVVSGFSLSGLPSVTITFTPTGSCSWRTGITNTLPTSANNSAVVPITCIVTTPSVSVNLPTISLSALSAIGKTGGDTRFPIGLSCAARRKCLYHPERRHHTRQHNLAAHARRDLNGAGHQAENPEQRRTGGFRARFGRAGYDASMAAGPLEQHRRHSAHGAVLPR